MWAKQFKHCNKNVCRKVKVGIHTEARKVQHVIQALVAPWFTVTRITEGPLRVHWVGNLPRAPELQKQGPLSSCTLTKILSCNQPITLSSLQPYVAHYAGISIASATTVI